MKQGFAVHGLRRAAEGIKCTRVYCAQKRNMQTPSDAGALGALVLLIEVSQAC